MNAQRLLDTFFELVRIDSPSFHEALMAAHCQKTLEDLGFSVRVDDSAEVVGSDTGNIIAHLPGTKAGHIVLSAHMDCVPPCEGVEPVVVDGVIRSAGETVLGADDKAGIAAIFEAVQAVLESGVERPDLTVLLTTCEEQSLLGATNLEEGLFEGPVPCFVFDAAGAPGAIVIGSPSHHNLKATFRGKAAHAGVEPERGVSAIQMAAAAIQEMELGRLDKTTTANIGIIEGGRETNIIADECKIEGECRALHDDAADALIAQMTEALHKGAARYGGEVEIVWHTDYPSVFFAEDHPFIKQIATVIESVGLTPAYNFSGGGSDANILCAKGIRAIALGIGMTNFHGVDEFISVEDLNNTTRLTEALITEFAS